MTDEEYYEFIQPYEDAKQMLLTRLDVLNHNLYGEASARPIHNIQCRIKKKQSIEEKLQRKGKEPTVMNAKDYLQDIAGVRVICYFVDDIYNLTELLKSQSDLIVIKERDYIGNPKPNGYRSYHVIVGGSGASGSRYNQFKIRYSSRSNIYLIYKNMPVLQIIINLPFLVAGFGIKILFFTLKGFGREYIAGIKNGFQISKKNHKIPFKFQNLSNYFRIQVELWVNIFRRLCG